MGRIKNCEQGSSTSNVLVVITIFVIIFLGVVFYTNTVTLATKKSLDVLEIKKASVGKARAILAIMEEDETPQSDTLFDEVWATVEKDDAVELEDISSRLNPNWVSQEMLGHLAKNMLTPPLSFFMDAQDFGINDFVDYRKANGILADIRNTYSDYFEEEVFDEYLTEYNYFNFNISDKTALANLFVTRTGNESDGKRFEEKYQFDRVPAGKKMNNKGFHNRNTIIPSGSVDNLEGWYRKEALGQSAFDETFPVINAEPVMNLNFVPEALLTGILKYKKFKLKEAAVRTKVKNWIKKRTENEVGLTIHDRDSIMQGTANFTKGDWPFNTIHHYFGVVTWFWKLTVTDRDYTLTWIVARIPPEKGIVDNAREKTNKPVFRVVEERFEPVVPQPPDPSGEPGDEEGEPGDEDMEPGDEEFMEPLEEEPWGSEEESPDDGAFRVYD